MSKTKQDIDKHVANVLRSIKTERERHSRGFQIARLYFEAKEYDSAKRYLELFLNMRETYAPAHKLLAQILERQGQTEKAITAYIRSLDLDDTQKDVLVKICELYCQTDLDPDRARYWAERVEKACPHNDIVFKLRAKIYETGDLENHQDDLEQLISSELQKRPNDPNIRIKMLRLYIDTERINEAYIAAMETEKRKLYPTHLPWYECLLDILQEYKNKNINGAYHQQLLSALNRATGLCLEQCKVAYCSDMLHRFDQMVCGVNTLGLQGDEWKIFYTEMQAQLFFHAGTLMLKKAQVSADWREPCELACACYLASLSIRPPNIQAAWYVKAQETDRKMYYQWYQEACQRFSQCGHMLQNFAVQDLRAWITKIQGEYCSQEGKDKLFKALFSLPNQKGSKANSYLASNSVFTTFNPEVPSREQLKEYDDVCHMLRPDSLHHVVWICLQHHSSRDLIQPQYDFHIFDDLLYDVVNLSTATPETLSQLDMEAFLYAVVRSVSLQVDARYRSGTVDGSTAPKLLPASLCAQQLCLKEQEDWWKTAYMLCNNLAKEHLGKLRQVLQRGLETVRLVGIHGMDVTLMVHLARTFEERTETLGLEHQSMYVHARACHYWKGALETLEKLTRGRSIRPPKHRLFSPPPEELTMEEIANFRKEGQFFMGKVQMEEGKVVEAISTFGEVDWPEASFYQAQLYKKLALEEGGRSLDESRLEDSDKQVALLTKAKDALYLTMDRIKGDRLHRLTSPAAEEIEDIESRLERLESDYPSGIREAPSFSLPADSVDGSMRMFAHSTPQRPSFTPISSPSSAQKSRLKPSPERLNAQMRSLTYSQDTMVKALIEELRDSRKTIQKLQEKMLEMEAERQEERREAEERWHQEKERRDREELERREKEQEREERRIKEERERMEREQLEKERREQRERERREREDMERREREERERREREERDKREREERERRDREERERKEREERERREREEKERKEREQERERLAQEANAPSLVPPVHGPLPHMIPGHPTPPHPRPGYYPPYGPEYEYMYRPPMYYPQPMGSPLMHHYRMPTPHGRQQPGFPPTAAPTQLEDIGLNEADLGLSGEDYVCMDDLVNGEANNNGDLPDGAGVAQPEASGMIPRWQMGAEAPGMDGAKAGLPHPQHRPGVPGVPGAGLSAAVGYFGPPGQMASVYSPPGQSFGPGFFADRNQAGLLMQGASFPGQDEAAVGGPFRFHLPAVSAAINNSATRFPLSMPEHAAVDGSMIPTAATQVSPATKITTVISPQRGVTSTSPSKPRRDTEHSESEADDSYREPEFAPLITLPEKVDVVTGEEDENCLFENRAKLFRFSEQQWKERGLGNIKILHNKNSQQVRILMRREQVHKVCANHLIKADTDIAYKNEDDKKVLTWRAVDHTDNEPCMEQFCVKFKTEELTAQFKDQFEAAKQIASQKPQTSKPAATSVVPPVTTSPPSQAPPKVTAASSQEVPKTTSAASYAFTTTSQPSSVPRLGPPTTVASTTVIKTAGFTVAVSHPQPSSTGSFVFGTTPAQQQPSSGGFSFGSTSSSTPASDMLKSVAEQSRGEETEGWSGTAAEAPKNVFGGFSFNSTPSIQETKQPATPEESKPQDAAKDMATKPPNPFANFSFGAVTSSPDSQQNASPQQPSTAPVTTKQPLFGSAIGTTGPTFASLASSNQPADFSTRSSSSQGFGMAGKPLFQNQSPAAKDRSSDHIEEYEPEVDFKPLVSLPEVMDHKTGEEDETKLFGHRAKLFRLDAETTQWKERGVGEIKILRNETTGRCRILMRREQVLKLCANHTITKDMKLAPLASSDKAWCWFAQDYSEEEMKTEQLAAKFKTQDLALRFKEAFEKCQAAMVEQKNEVSRTTTTGPAESARPKVQQSLAEQFKAKEGEWDCSGCYVRNKPETDKCVACMGPKDPPPQPPPASVLPPVNSSAPPFQLQPGQQSLADLFKAKEGEWECNICLVRNKLEAVKCVACETPNPDASSQTGVSSTTIFGSAKEQSGLPSTMTMNSGGGFSFGSLNNASSGSFLGCFAQKPAAQDTETEISSTSGGFMIAPTEGSKQNFGGPFSFGQKQAPSTTTASGSSGFKFGSDPPASTSTESSDKGFVFGKPAAQSSAFVFKGPAFSIGSTGFGEAPTVTVSQPVTVTSTTDSGSQGFVFGSQPSTVSGFPTFDKPLSSNIASSTPAKPENSFGSPSFTFTPVKTDSAKSPLKSPLGPKTPQSPEFYQNEDDEDSHIYFPPVVSLPDKVEIKTGEEEENCLYSHRAKLYRFRENEWRERGLGLIKILQHRTMQHIRLLMRREQILKLCLNHLLRPDMELTPMPGAQGKAWCWHAEDFSDEEPSHEQFAIKFKTEAIANEFKKVFDAAKQRVEKSQGDTFLEKFSFKADTSNPTSPVAGFEFQSPANTTSAEVTPARIGSGKSPLNRSSRGSLLEQLLVDGSEGGAEEPEDLTMDPVFGETVKPTEEETAKASEFQLSPCFYLYKQRKPCRGCIGCDPDTFNFNEIGKEGDVVYVLEDLPTEEQIEEAKRWQLPKCFYLYSKRPDCKGCIGCDSENFAFDNIGKAGAVKPKPQRESAKPTGNVTAEADSTTATPMFGTSAGQSDFAALAASSDGSFAFGKKTDAKPFAFSGAGASLFSQPAATERGAGDEGDVAPSPDVHFEPLVQLSEVEVKTGEEDEDVVYSQRAKLFRYDSDTNQWKERGIGEMKILKHKTTGKYRLLLRREQIYKLACNHSMTTDMELKPMATSEVAWCWFAVDYAEDEGKFQQFAVKFKNKDLAVAFKEKFEECQNDLKKPSGMSASARAPPVDEDPKSISQPQTETRETEAPRESEEEDAKEQEEDDDDEYETEEEEEDTDEVLFRKRVTLNYMVDKKPKMAGMGEMLLVVDDDVDGAARVKVTSDKGKLLCNHVICQQHTLAKSRKHKFCEWTANDFSTDEAVRRTFRAYFSSDPAATEFSEVFKKAVDTARELDISELQDGASVTGEITVPEVVSSPPAAQDDADQR